MGANAPVFGLRLYGSEVVCQARPDVVRRVGYWSVSVLLCGRVKVPPAGARYAQRMTGARRVVRPH